jgi:hypothetical protein
VCVSLVVGVMVGRCTRGELLSLDAFHNRYENVLSYFLSAFADRTWMMKDSTSRGSQNRQPKPV